MVNFGCASTNKLAVKTYKPEAVDVSALRKNMDMTQEQFAARLGFSVGQRYVIGSVGIEHRKVLRWCF